MEGAEAQAGRGVHVCLLARCSSAVPKVSTSPLHAQIIDICSPPGSLLRAGGLGRSRQFSRGGFCVVPEGAGGGSGSSKLQCSLLTGRRRPRLQAFEKASGACCACCAQAVTLKKVRRKLAPSTTAQLGFHRKTAAAGPARTSNSKGAQERADAAGRSEPGAGSLNSDQPSAPPPVAGGGDAWGAQMLGGLCIQLCAHSHACGSVGPLWEPHPHCAWTCSWNSVQLHKRASGGAGPRGMLCDAPAHERPKSTCPVGYQVVGGDRIGTVNSVDNPPAHRSPFPSAELPILQAALVMLMPAWLAAFLPAPAF